jgi:glycosyltransferase involved in cell wall biosynthesis
VPKPPVFWKLYGTNINEPTCRRRGLWVVDGLRELGWEVRTNTPEGCQIVVLQRVATAPEIKEHQQAERTVLFEQNDNLLSKGTPFYRPTEEEAVRAADFVAVSCRYLQHVYGRLNPCCLIAPEMLEPEFWTTPKANLPDKPLVLSWHGLSDNLQYVEPLVRELASVRDLRLKIVTSERDSHRNSNRDRVAAWPVPTDFVRWELATFVREIADAHAGFIPLPDTEFCRSKGHHKVVSSMALNLPCVASNVPGYREVIKHGENGLLAETPADWIEAIEKLRDASYRKELGDRGREFSRRFTKRAVAAKWDQLLTLIVEHGGQP